jgi:hypothetical protein
LKGHAKLNLNYVENWMGTSITRVALVDDNRERLINNLQRLIDESSGPLRIDTENKNGTEVVYLRERSWGAFIFETLFAGDAGRANATNHARTEIEHKLGHILLRSTGRQTATLKQSEGMVRRRSSSGAEYKVALACSNDDSSSANFKAEQAHSTLFHALRDRACSRKASQGIGFWCSNEPALEKTGTQSKKIGGAMQEPVHELHTVPIGMSVFKCSPLAVIADVGILCNLGKWGKLPKYLGKVLKHPFRFYVEPDINSPRTERVKLFKSFYMVQMQLIDPSAATAVVAPKPELRTDAKGRQFSVVSADNAAGMILAAQEINARRKNGCPISFLFAVSNQSEWIEVDIAIKRFANANIHSNPEIAASISPGSETVRDSRHSPTGVPAREETSQNASFGGAPSSSSDPNRITNDEDILI